MIRNYRMKPIASVQAAQVTPETVDAIAAWIGGVVVETTDALDPEKKFREINVPTMGTTTRAAQGDYVIKNQVGMVDVQTQREFESRYEPI